MYFENPQCRQIIHQMQVVLLGEVIASVEEGVYQGEETQER